MPSNWLRFRTGTLRQPDPPVTSRPPDRFNPIAWIRLRTCPRLRSARTIAAATVTEVIRFADCELNLDRVVLRRGGEEIRVEPQVFDVLAYLVQHRGAVVRKEELPTRSGVTAS